MNWVKGFALATCLATPLSVIVAAGASAPAAAAPGANLQTAASTKVAALSEAEKKAKLTECTKKANAKKLHGDERLKFRAECIKS